MSLRLIRMTFGRVWRVALDAKSRWNMTIHMSINNEKTRFIG